MLKLIVFALFLLSAAAGLIFIAYLDQSVVPIAAPMLTIFYIFFGRELLKWLKKK